MVCVKKTGMADQNKPPKTPFLTKKLMKHRKLEK